MDATTTAVIKHYMILRYHIHFANFIIEQSYHVLLFSLYILIMERNKYSYLSIYLP